MRRYRIEISRKDGKGIDAVFDSTNQDGSMNPGALNIELDVSQYNFASPWGYAHLRIWGLPLNASQTITALQDLALSPAQVTIGQATDLNGSFVKIYAGMSEKGLPLSKIQAPNYGIILQGLVFQAFGNWVDTDMTLDVFIMTDGQSDQNTPLNIVLDWKKGTPLADALKTTLKRAYPDFQDPEINISDKLVLTEDDTNHYPNLQQFAQHVRDTSLGIIKKGYFGVDITISGNQIIVYDGSVASDPKKILFTDMIGQPTWIEPYSVQANLVLRHDLQVSNYIQFPTAPTISVEAEQTLQAKDKSVFQGVFIIDAVRHVANFRQPTANSWITTINARSTTVDEDTVVTGQQG